MAEKIQTTGEDGYFVVGKSYIIRTVTNYYTGRATRITPTFVVLESAAWIADTGRWADAIKKGSLSEVEPYPGEVAVGIGAIVDASEWLLELPRDQK